MKIMTVYSFLKLNVLFVIVFLLLEVLKASFKKLQIILKWNFINLIRFFKISRNSEEETIKLTEINHLKYLSWISRLDTIYKHNLPNSTEKTEGF